MNTDYLKYYDLENYLFDDVRRNFHENHFLSVFDFFCIIIWKANRAKTNIFKKLLEKGEIEQVVKDMTLQIYDTRKEEKLINLLEKGLSLSMSSAILTVLYPDDFTIYDIRVCETLGIKKKEYNNNPKKTYNEYLEYVEKVKENTPSHLSLRDKDRYLWGESFYCDLSNDVTTNFERLLKDKKSKNI